MVSLRYIAPMPRCRSSACSPSWRSWASFLSSQVGSCFVFIESPDEALTQLPAIHVPVAVALRRAQSGSGQRRGKDDGRGGEEQGDSRKIIAVELDDVYRSLDSIRGCQRGAVGGD